MLLMAALAAGMAHATEAPDGPEHGEAHVGEEHRSLGVKILDLVALGEERTTSWFGLGVLLELPLRRRLLVEVAVHGLSGTPRAPGFAVPVDLLLKRVWSRGRWVLTAGGGPALTYMRRESRDELFPGFLGTAGASYWLGEHRDWGLLVELDLGGSLEREGFVPEVETAVGVVFKL